MKKTTNYQFPQYDPTGTDGDLHGTDFITNTFGVSDDCFAGKLDSLLKSQDGRVSDLEKHQGLTLASVNATKTSDTTYTATDRNIKEYDVGMTIILHLDTTNVGKITLNINGFGAVPIKKVDGQGSVIDLEANDLVVNRGRMVQYDGMQFMLINDDVCSIQKRETVVNILSSAVSIGTPVSMNTTVMDNDLVSVSVDGKLMAENTDYTRIGNKLTFKTALTSGQKIIMLVDHSFVLRQVGEDATTLAGLQTDTQSLKSSVSGINSHLSSTDTSVINANNNANGRIPKVSSSTYGNVPVLQSDGTLKDGGKAVESIILKSDLLTYVYPVGSIYMNIKNTSPASFLGGTWQAMQDRFLIGASGNYVAESVGGETTHTLTVDEIPSHKHSASKAGFIEQTYGDSACYTQAPGSDGNFWGVGSFAQTEAIGGGKAHNNMPPYFAVYMWKRVA